MQAGRRGATTGCAPPVTAQRWTCIEHGRPRARFQPPRATPFTFCFRWIRGFGFLASHAEKRSVGPSPPVSDRPSNAEQLFPGACVHMWEELGGKNTLCTSETGSDLGGVPPGLTLSLERASSNTVVESSPAASFDLTDHTRCRPAAQSTHARADVEHGVREIAQSLGQGACARPLAGQDNGVGGEAERRHRPGWRRRRGRRRRWRRRRWRQIRELPELRRARPS